jgi:hypothetical protein
MKVIVDKLPTKKEDCLFCIKNYIEDSPFHSCMFQINASDFGNGLGTDIDTCYLECGKKCPYLKELFSQEDNDTIYVNDKGELIGI